MQIFHPRAELVISDVFAKEVVNRVTPGELASTGRGGFTGYEEAFMGGGFQKLGDAFDCFRFAHVQRFAGGHELGQESKDREGLLAIKDGNVGLVQVFGAASRVLHALPERAVVRGRQAIRAVVGKPVEILVEGP